MNWFQQIKKRRLIIQKRDRSKCHPQTTAKNIRPHRHRRPRPRHHYMNIIVDYVKVQ